MISTGLSPGWFASMGSRIAWRKHRASMCVDSFATGDKVTGFSQGLSQETLFML